MRSPGKRVFSGLVDGEDTVAIHGELGDRIRQALIAVIKIERPLGNRREARPCPQALVPVVDFAAVAGGRKRQFRTFQPRWGTITSCVQGEVKL